MNTANANPAAIRLTSQESFFVKEFCHCQFSITSICGSEKASAFFSLKEKGGVTRNEFGYYEINQNAIDGMNFNHFIRLV